MVKGSLGISSSKTKKTQIKSVKAKGEKNWSAKWQWAVWEMWLCSSWVLHIKKEGKLYWVEIYVSKILPR